MKFKNFVQVLKLVLDIWRRNYFTVEDPIGSLENDSTSLQTFSLSLFMTDWVVKI